MLVCSLVVRSTQSDSTWLSKISNNGTVKITSVCHNPTKNVTKSVTMMDEWNVIECYLVAISLILL